LQKIARKYAGLGWLTFAIYDERQTKAVKRKPQELPSSISHIFASSGQRAMIAYTLLSILK
jgi:hypothetical protein